MCWGELRTQDVYPLSPIIKLLGIEIQHWNICLPRKSSGINSGYLWMKLILILNKAIEPQFSYIAKQSVFCILLPLLDKLHQVFNLCCLFKETMIYAESMNSPNYCGSWASLLSFSQNKIKLGKYQICTHIKTKALTIFTIQRKNKEWNSKEEEQIS